MGLLRYGPPSLVFLWKGELMQGLSDAPFAYAPLWCKTNYSFLYGASHPEEMIEQASQLGLSHIAIVDKNGLYGTVKAHAKAKEVNIHLIIGAQLDMSDGSSVVVLVKNTQGYTNLCRLITRGCLRGKKGDFSLHWPELCDKASGLYLLWGYEGSLLGEESDRYQAVAISLQASFAERLYAMIPRHSLPQDTDRERRVRHRAASLNIQTLAVTEVLYHTEERRCVQDVVTCIRHGVSFSTCGGVVRANSQHGLLSPEDFGNRYSDDRGAIERTMVVASLCDFSLDMLDYRYPEENLPDGTNSHEHLALLTYEGADTRYQGEVPNAVRLQIQKELSLIRELSYGGYFLTIHEIVQYCRQEDILCQGRGSAANSVVCYCLGITSVDPVRMDLLFERFLSKERAEPPDIDLDIEHERREQVIQHVYQKYGRSRAAMVANVIRYRRKSAIRDVGKVLDIPKTELDRLAKSVDRYGESDLAETSGVSPRYALLRQLVGEIIDFPRHLGIHPGGFLLGEGAVCDIVPIENATMDKRTVIQWDKDDIETLGLFKVDLLGLGALSMLHRSLCLLREYKQLDYSMASLPKEDKATYDMICRGDTVGVFQIESRAQMAMLPRLLPRCFYDLVVEISIVRPGPITGGMVHPYLRRRRGEEKVDYPHDCLVPVLEKTLGIPLFQEQVMKLAIVAADYTPGEADQLRRDMAAWRRTGRIEQHKQKLVTRMVAKGIPQEFAERVFAQIRGFGEYGFPESHAASFALIAYATSWLRCHHPDVFLCAILNSQPMGFYSPATLVRDAVRHGVFVFPIDVMHSEWNCCLERKSETQWGVRMGLRYVKGLSHSTGQAIVCARKLAQFTTLLDFVRRTGTGAKEQTLLAECGALRYWKKNRPDALWQIKGASVCRDDSLPIESRAQAEYRDTNNNMPRFPKLSVATEIVWDYKKSQHSTQSHLLGPYRAELRASDHLSAQEILCAKDGSTVKHIGMAICRQRPGTSKGVLFMTLEDETGFVNLVVWKDVYTKYRSVLRRSSLLGVQGKVQSQDQVVHVIVQSFWQPSLQQKIPRLQSRDFR